MSPLKTAGGHHDDGLRHLRRAVLSSAPVSGLTHRFYSYPARFSPEFAAAAIECFSAKGDLVLDPFMGGGTTVVESFARGRRAVGCDLNALAVWIARVKSTPLAKGDVERVTSWANTAVPRFLYSSKTKDADLFCPQRTTNLDLPWIRPLRKVIGVALESLDALDTPRARGFSQCAILRAGQWALNGRRSKPSVQAFRGYLQQTALKMLDGMAELRGELNDLPERFSPILINGNARNLAARSPFKEGKKADLIVTSPPYPNVHVLYHRWQVDGRKETPAPYWITGCEDGQGPAYYNFASRRHPAGDAYFHELLRTMSAVRAVARDGAMLIQLVSFSNPDLQLPQYLSTLERAGFREFHKSGPGSALRRVWRHVPSRRWYVRARGAISSSREVLLIHEAA